MINMGIKYRKGKWRRNRKKERQEKKKECRSKLHSGMKEKPSAARAKDQSCGKGREVRGVLGG